MAGFGIKQIKAILSEHGIPLENIDKCAEELCGRHTADLDSIKEQRDSFKADAEKLPEVQKELDTLKKDDYKTKYENEKAAHDKLKADNASKEERATKEKAFSKWLKDQNFTEKGAAKIIKYGGYIDGIKLDKDGNIEDGEALEKSVGEEWGEYKSEKKVEGTPTPNPPQGNDKPAAKPSRAAQLAAQYHANLYGGSTDTSTADMSGAKGE